MELSASFVAVPAFMDYPTAITPLAKCKPGDESIVERFEFFAGNNELANAYTELNDPEDQMTRLQEQMRQKQAEKNEEVDVIDKDFVEAMEKTCPLALAQTLIARSAAAHLRLANPTIKTAADIDIFRADMPNSVMLSSSLFVAVAEE